MAMKPRTYPDETCRSSPFRQAGRAADTKDHGRGGDHPDDQPEAARQAIACRAATEGPLALRGRARRRAQPARARGVRAGQGPDPRERPLGARRIVRRRRQRADARARRTRARSRPREHRRHDRVPAPRPAERLRPRGPRARSRRSAHAGLLRAAGRARARLPEPPEPFFAADPVRDRSVRIRSGHRASRRPRRPSTCSRSSRDCPSRCRSPTTRTTTPTCSRRLRSSLPTRRSKSAMAEAVPFTAALGESAMVDSAMVDSGTVDSTIAPPAGTFELVDDEPFALPDLGVGHRRAGARVHRLRRTDRRRRRRPRPSTARGRPPTRRRSTSRSAARPSPHRPGPRTGIPTRRPAWETPDWEPRRRASGTSPTRRRRAGVVE